MKRIKSLKVESRRSLRLLFFFAAISLLGGCSKETTERASLSEPVLSRQYRQGSAMAIVSVSETNIPTSGKIILMLDVHAPEHDSVVFPEIGTRAEPFTVADRYTEPVQTLPNGKQLHRCVWTLVPALPSQTTFQPFEIQAGAVTLQIEPIEITVRSLLPEGIDTFEIKDIAPSETLLPEQKQKQKWGFAFLGIAATLAGAVGVIRRVRRPKKIRIISPTEAAFQSLKNLPSEPLEKIHQLSEILLAFIGGCLNVPATGKTINEVIPLLPKEILLGRRELLEEFLLTAERIRFSNRVPLEFPEKYELYIRDFVEQMEEEEPCD